MIDLLYLAQSWRDLATRLKVKYPPGTKAQAECVIEAYEQCARELEDKVKEPGGGLAQTTTTK